jgi:hypothetical protein
VQLWDIVPLHLQEGKETQHSFRLPTPGKMPANVSTTSTAQIRIRPEAVTRKDSGRYVRFGILNIGLKNSAAHRRRKSRGESVDEHAGSAKFPVSTTKARSS